jgi:hypothetical protein
MQIQNTGSFNFLEKGLDLLRSQFFYLFFAFAFVLDFALAFDMQSISLHRY